MAELDDNLFRLRLRRGCKKDDSTKRDYQKQGGQKQAGQKQGGGSKKHGFLLKWSNWLGLGEETNPFGGCGQVFLLSSLPLPSLLVRHPKTMLATMKTTQMKTTNNNDRSMEIGGMTEGGVRYCVSCAVIFAAMRSSSPSDMVSSGVKTIKASHIGITKTNDHLRSSAASRHRRTITAVLSQEVTNRVVVEMAKRKMWASKSFSPKNSSLKEGSKREIRSAIK